MIRSRSISYHCTVFIILLFCLGCTGISQQKKTSLKSPDLMKKQCELIGEPRVLRISEHVWAAVGYDLANEILIHTPEGNIIIDPLMSPKRGDAAKRDLLANAPKGPIKAIIYTHSHIDHIGGASIWMDDDPEIWATDNFIEHFYKQYQVFLPIETIRGRRQFGENVPLPDLPCNGIGRRTDIRASLEGAGIRLPTRTFSGSKKLDFGGVIIEMIEAHGETHDQLMVWIPKDRTLIAADNFYWAFPNLYTIRGSSPRPVDDWIKSIDRMRALRPRHLVPCHTIPVEGEPEINSMLTNYRDAIQWVRDEVIRGANKGHDLDTLAENIRLPEHLSGLAYTEEFYGQVDWSVKGIYTSSLGWFDGRPDKLYPMNVREASMREVNLMGGPARIMEMADAALYANDFRWAVHLLSKLSDSGLAKGGMQESLKEKLALAYEKLASTLYNLNGRGYLLESAYEMRHGIEKSEPVKLDETVVANVPLENIFTIMATRLDPVKAKDLHETVYFQFTDEKRRFIVTVRKGIAEVAEGEPLPGTPEPIAVITTDALTFRSIATRLISPLKAQASGKVKIQGSWIRYIKWNQLFETG